MQLRLVECHPALLAFEELAYEVLSLWAEALPLPAHKSHLPLHDFGDRLGVVLGFEGGLPSDQLEDGHSQRPEVDALIIAPAEVDLRGEVAVAADDGEHLPLFAHLEGLLGNAEVDDLDGLSLLVVEDVLRLDVAVADVVAVEVGDYPHQPPYNAFQLLLVLHLAFREIRERDVLHNSVGQVLLLVVVKLLVVGHLGVLQGLDDLEHLFGLSHLLLLNLGLLHCVDCLGVAVLAFVDTGIAALTQFLQQLVFLGKGVGDSQVGLFGFRDVGFRLVGSEFLVWLLKKFRICRIFLVKFVLDLGGDSLQRDPLEALPDGGESGVTFQGGGQNLRI